MQPLCDAAGAVVDWAVRMRQFPAGALASELLAAGRLDAAAIDSLAQTLADFHRAAPVLAAAAPAADAGATALAVLDQLAALAPVDARLAPLRAWTVADAARLAPFWAARHAAGQLRECHGDLHLANLVALDGRLTAFDCIEFDPALRWIDPQADLAFPVMDLIAHGRADLGFRLLDGWLQASGDFAGVAALRFHLVARATVRALVARLAAADGAGRGAEPSAPSGDAPDAGPGLASGAEPGAAPPDYLAVAARLTRPAAPRLLITHGLSGAGKSRLALQLVEQAGALRLRSDVERKRLFGLAPLASSRADAALAGASGIYTPQATRATFDRLLALAGPALDAGWPVIVDAAFLRRAERDAFRALAAGRALPFAILDCRADPALLGARLAARAAAGNDPSEADAAVLARQQATQEALAPDEAGVIAVDSGGAVDAAALARRWLAG
nr:bifunctional aminoglycoside phosphotransferase/ATP-binding protein [Derxia lacustris]